ncbi:hypothetical protein B0H19DRAFT_1273625 [Mycena capillaripes]|nr:hypothetical protein B0H19DRAFT_1273625 [Mycena capillaripes]
MGPQRSVFRALFTEEEADLEMESETESNSPRSSPTPIRYLNRPQDPVTPRNAGTKVEPQSAPSTLVNSPARDEVDSPMHPRAPSPPGLVRFQHLTQGLGSNEAMQEISCEYNKPNRIYLQYIQFSLGGVAAPAIAGTVSPRAVFRTWQEHAPNPAPFWVKYHEYGYAIRGVSADFAIGRAFLLAHCPENICISNDLLKWAEKFNPMAHTLPSANFQFLSGPAPEDQQDGGSTDSEDDDA